MKRLVILLLLLVGCRNVPLPPTPPGLTPRFDANRLAPPLVVIPPQGFTITNLSLVGNLATLQWQGGRLPFQPQGSPALSPAAWVGIGNPIISREITFTTGDNHYWRVQGSVPLLSITNNTLTWKTPDVMPDTLTDFLVDRRGDPPPANQDQNDLTGWNVNQTGFPATVPVASGPPYKLTDSSAPSQAWYRVRETTANGIVVPYNVITNVLTSNFARNYGGTGSDGGTALAVDASGNIFVAGYLRGTATFGGVTLTSAGNGDVFLAKYSSVGAVIWAKRFGGSGDETPTCIALDSTGSIVVGGYFLNTGNFGGSDLISAGTQDGFIAKYDSQGNHIWSQRFGGKSTDAVNAVAIDSQDNIILTGFFHNSSFDVPPVAIAGITITPYGTIQADTFLAKISPTGTGVWAKNFPSSDADFGNGVAVDKRDNSIILAGYAVGNINLGGGLLSGECAYLAKFDSTGVHLWSKSFSSPSPYFTRFWSMTIDQNGDIGVTGDFSSSTDLGGGTIMGSSYGEDLFVAKYLGSNGAYVWATPILGVQNSSARPNFIVSDTQGNFLVTGFIQGTYNFGPKQLSSVPGLPDGFVVKFSGAGSLAWAHNFASSDSAGGFAVAASATSPVVAGYFTGSANPVGQALIAIGPTDVILMKLTPAGTIP